MKKWDRVFISRELLKFQDICYAHLDEVSLIVVVTIDNNLFSLDIDIQDFTCFVKDESLDEFLQRRYDIDRAKVLGLIYAIRVLVANYKDIRKGKVCRGNI